MSPHSLTPNPFTKDTKILCIYDIKKPDYMNKQKVEESWQGEWGPTLIQ